MRTIIMDKGVCTGFICQIICENVLSRTLVSKMEQTFNDEVHAIFVNISRFQQPSKTFLEPWKPRKVFR